MAKRKPPKDVQDAYRAIGLEGPRKKTPQHPKEFWAMPVKDRQAFLKNRGYNVKIDGKSGPQTFAAAWAYQHKMKPAQYNKLPKSWHQQIWDTHAPHPKVTPGKSRPVSKGITATMVRNTNRSIATAQRQGKLGPDPRTGKTAAPPKRTPPKKVAPPKRTTKPIIPTVDPTGGLYTGMDADVGDVIAPKLGNTQTLLDADQYANVQAGLEFDPQIYQTQVDQATLAAQAPKNLEEVQRLYAPVLASQAAGTQQNAAMSASTAAAQDAFVQGLVSSLGGSANAGAGGVAQSGVDSSALIRSLGAIQAGTDANMATNLQTEQAQQVQQQRSKDADRAAALASQMVSLRGQRGAAAAAARLDALKYNNDARNTNFENAEHIREFNQGTEQQNFQNRIAAQNAIIAATAAKDTHLANSLQNAYALMFPGEVFGKSKASAGKKGHTVTPADIQRATAGATKRIMVKDPDTGQMVLDPRLQHNPKALVQAVNAGFVGLSSKNKAAKAARDRLLRMYGVTPQPGWNF